MKDGRKTRWDTWLSAFILKFPSCGQLYLDFFRVCFAIWAPVESKYQWNQNHVNTLEAAFLLPHNFLSIWLLKASADPTMNKMPLQGIISRRFWERISVLKSFLQTDGCLLPEKVTQTILDMTRKQQIKPQMVFYLAHQALVWMGYYYHCGVHCCGVGVSGMEFLEIALLVLWNWNFTQAF